MPIKWTPEKDQLFLLKILETHNIKLDPKKIVEAWPSNQEKPTPRAISERLVRIRQTNKAGGGTDSGSLVPASGQSSAASTPKKQRPSPTVLTPSSSKRKKIGSDESMQPSPLKSEMDIDGNDEEDPGHEGDHESEGGAAIDIETPSKKGKARGLFDVPAFAEETIPTSAEASLSSGVNHPLTKAGSSLGQNMRNNGLGLASGDGSPVRPKRDQTRARRAPVQYGMVSYDDYLDDEESSGQRMSDTDNSASDFVPDAAGLDDDEIA